MKEARLRWFGHVLQREENSVAKTALKLDVSGVMPRERPKTRYLESVKLDMIDARFCTADAMDRTKWKTRSRKADCSNAGQTLESRRRRRNEGFGWH
ncbi:hypothetical protein RB195_020541 [Necator americanus]|uniref:Uncharacterized protein n=1 Tax=Necator americanus TaxID=51031 RepID=A0ABR1CKM7_NECAM